MLKNYILKLIYKERATSESYLRYLKKHCLSFGEEVFIVNPHKTWIDKEAIQFISIGNRCQILSGVTILAHDESYSVCGEVYGDYPRSQKITSIGDNVFIGMNSIILMGATIEDNVIIGAGSVVSGHVSGNSVYAGNPAKKIMSLEEYHSKHIESYEKSAYTYIKGFESRYGRWPTEDECHVYSMLFRDEPIEGHNKWPQVARFVAENNSTKEKFKNVKSFIDYYEGKMSE